MTETGKRNPACGIETAGLKTSGTVRYNFGAAFLTEEAIRRGEAKLTAHGALVAETGQHTGRSPKDKFVVRDAAPNIAMSGGTTTSRCRAQHFERCTPNSWPTRPTRICMSRT
jgi:ATP-dependent phosphoenolpyruvate carboxykinase